MRTEDGWAQYRAAWDALPEHLQDTDEAQQIMDDTFAQAGLSHGSIFMRWATSDAEPGVASVLWAHRHCATIPDLQGAWARTALLAADRIATAYGLDNGDA